MFLPKEYDDPVLGKKRLIVIQTVYFISSVDEKFCSKMVLLLNSTPIRAFIKSFAERAMGGYFRHISWTVGLVPIPNHIDELPINLKDPVKINEAVSKIYRLTNEETKAISDYDSFIEKEVIKST